MKKFLSLLLAVAMIVSMVSLLALSIGAADGEGSAMSTSEFPSLVITEMITNSPNYNNQLLASDKWYDNIPAFHHTARNEQYMQPVLVSVGADVKNYYKISGSYGTGDVSFVKCASDEKAVSGTTYFTVARGDIGYYDSGQNTFQFMEIYNAGTETVNLYDYNLLRDTNANVDGGTVGVNKLANAAGDLDCSKLEKGFLRVDVAVGDSVAGYYTRVNEYEFKICASGAKAVSGTAYYRAVENEYLVSNPTADEGAWLEPGKAALIWFYSARDYVFGLTKEHFKAMYEWKMSSLPIDNDLSDTLVLAIGTTDSSAYYKSSGWEWTLGTGSGYFYGIAEATMTDTRDAARETDWISWVRYDNLVASTSATEIVTSNAYPYSHGVDSASVNFLYNLHGKHSGKEGNAYTIADKNMSPGFLRAIQKLSMPNLTGETEVPDLAITEIMPDSAGADAYDYVEIVNTAGHAINIFDYSFGARTSTYMNYQSEYFNKVNTIIPGDYGNILAANGASIYYDKAPTNVGYDAGWLQPGEVALVWAYNNASYVAEATFDDFYDEYDLDPDLKVFAMDADNSAASGRSTRQDLSHQYFYFYGFIKNTNLEWYGDMYCSEIVMKPVTFPTAVSMPAYSGISVEAAECVALCNPVLVSGRNLSTGMGELVSYQYTWNRMEGTCNRVASFMDMTLISGNSNTNMSIYTPCTTEDWKASPGVLVSAQQTAMLTNKGASRYVVYSEDFDNLGTVEGYDAVAELLGLSGVSREENSYLWQAHNENVAATESGAGKFLSIRDGKLYITNNGASDDYMVLFDDDVMRALRTGSYTVEFGMTYQAASTSVRNGYSTILYNFDAEGETYGAPIIRISGYGANTVVRNGQSTSIEAASTALNGKDVTSTSLTLYERLTADVANVNGVTILTGTQVLKDIALNVRVDVSVTNGVKIYVNDMLVSDTYDATSATFADWSLFVEESDGAQLAIKTSPGIAVAYDYITVYSDGLGADSGDMDVPSLYITEICLDPYVDGAYHAASQAAVSEAVDSFKYIEITNGGTAAVQLSDYYILKSDDNLHHGSNEKWTRGFALPTATVQPNESVVLLIYYGTVNTKKTNTKGESVVMAEAARDWLNIPKDTQIIALCKSQAAYRTFWPDYDKPATFAIGRKSFATSWTGVYTHDYRGIESMVVYNPALAHAASSGGANMGKGGTPLEGVAAHYFYGFDASSNYKIGMPVIRGNVPVLSRYAANSTTVSTAGQYNVGKLLSAQNDAFKDLRSLLTNGYRSGGGLAITEFICNPDDGFGGNANAYEALEITNTSHRPINLYDYAIARGNDGTYGALNSLNGVNGLTAGCPVGAEHKWYTHLQHIVNPEDGTVAPGESVVIWLYNDATTSFDYPTRDYVLVDDFRQYYAKHGNDLINATNEDGEYLVKVFVTPAEDGLGTRNLSNSGTRVYAVVPKIEMRAGSNVVGASPVSYIVVPMASLSYGLQWTKTSLTRTTTAQGISYDVNGSFAWNTALVEEVDFGTVLSVGDSVNGFYIRDEQGVYTPCAADAVAAADQLYYKHVGGNDYELVYVDVQLSVSDYFVITEDGKYAFANGTYDADELYYMLYYYTNVETLQPGFALSLNFVYGMTLAGNWGVGASLGSTKIGSYVVNADGVASSVTSNAFNAKPLVEMDILSNGVYENSLGYLVEAQKGMLSQAFCQAGELEDGTKLYYYHTVTGGYVGSIAPSVSDASISTSNSRGTGIQFTATFDRDAYDLIAALYGEENISFHMITMRAADAAKVSQIRPDLLDAAGAVYTLDEDITPRFTSSKVIFEGSSQYMQAGYYADVYCAYAYITVETRDGTVTLYSENAVSRSIKQVSANVMLDTKTEWSEEYCYEIETGVYSRYTAAQHRRFQEICAATRN